MNLKKLLSLLMIFCMIFSFVACGGRDKDDDDNGSSQSSSQRDDDDEDDDDKDDKDDKDDNDDDDDKGDKDDKDDKNGKDSKDKEDDVLASYDEVDLPPTIQKTNTPSIKAGVSGLLWLINPADLIPLVLVQYAKKKLKR